MVFYIKTYFIALVIFLFIDALWLGFAARKMYREQIGFILKEQFNFTAAAVFYLFFVMGLVFFVLRPADSWQSALLAGMFFGAVTYGTYDMTNLATIEGWPVMLTVVDIVWGTFLCGITAWLTYYLTGII